MTVISLLKPADVAALKCVYFQLAKTLKEIDWYGIDCNTQSYETDIELAFTYLQIIDSACTLTHAIECEIKNFIVKKSSFCVFSDNRCTSKYEVEQLNVFLLAENDNTIITENLNNIIT